METIKKFFIWAAWISLACVVGISLFRLGCKYDLNKSEWAYWVQALGSIGAIGSAIWLATSESRRRRSTEMALAQVTASMLRPRVLDAINFYENVIAHLEAILSRGVSQNWTEEMSKGIGRALSQNELWTPSEIAPLTTLHDDSAAKLAAASGLTLAVASDFSHMQFEDPTDETIDRFLRGNIAKIRQAVAQMNSAQNDLRRVIEELYDIEI